MIFEKVRDIMVDHFDVPADSITPDTTLQDDLGADSMDIMDLVMSLEDEYSIAIDIETELDGISTVGDIVEVLKTRGLE